MKNEVSTECPWHSIADVFPKGRRLDTNNQNFFVSRDYDGRFLLVAILPKRVDEKNLPNLTGVVPTLSVIEPEQTALVLALEDSSNLDKFEVVCRDLARYTVGYGGEELVKATLYRLTSWAKFIGPRRDGMGEAKVVGLWAELYTLYTSLIDALGCDVAIRSWLGPEGGKQDFVADQLAVEVKAHRAGFASFIEITSAEQLESQTDKLYLQKVDLSASEQDLALSLKGLESAIKKRLQNYPESTSDFNLAYNSRIENATKQELEEQYEVVSETLYEVKDEFPKITPQSLSGGIEKVTYKISCSSIESFIVPNSLFQEIING